MSERSDPIHQDREGTSHQAQSLVRQDKPLYTSEYNSEYDEESSEYDSELYDSEYVMSLVIRQRNQWIKRKLHKTQEQPTKENVHSRREQIDSK